MPRAYSADMRTRVIARVESGASRREAAEHYEVSPSTAVIWVKCFRETGRCSARPRGGSMVCEFGVARTGAIMMFPLSFLFGFLSALTRICRRKQHGRL